MRNERFIYLLQGKYSTIKHNHEKLEIYLSVTGQVLNNKRNNEKLEIYLSVTGQVLNNQA